MIVRRVVVVVRIVGVSLLVPSIKGGTVVRCELQPIDQTVREVRVRDELAAEDHTVRVAVGQV
jgi:hypothetical protein